MEHVVVYAEQGHFAGWPANNGLWAWEGAEILVGFSRGGYGVQTGHNILPPIHSLLARSRDGGQTWAVEEPAGYVGSGRALADLSHAIDFCHPGFAMRVTGTGYHGNEEPRGGFFISYDRGQSWQGPYGFGGLADDPQLAAAEWTPRTDYLVEGPGRCLVLLSARGAAWGSDRVFCARTVDGGRTFHLVSWVVPRDDPYRAVMPSTVRCSFACAVHPYSGGMLRDAAQPSHPVGPLQGSGYYAMLRDAGERLVTALRRREMDSDRCWIDAYGSEDGGRTWSFLSKVGDAGAHNGNPPALARLHDGRLCCVHGQRTARQILARYSDDEGRSWDETLVLRDDYQPVEGDADLGYPRLVQRADGRLVAVYYWTTAARPEQHIAATIWDPG